MNADNRESTGQRINKMGDVLAGLMARKGYAQLQTAEELQSVWSESVGPQLASHSVAGKVTRGKLEVLVNNSAVMQAISFIKPKILNTLKEKCPQHAIEDLRIKVGKID